MILSKSSIRSLLRSRGELFQDAAEGRQFDAVYFIMLVLSCLIALQGLLLNSPAIIIGAMLISPLMGPILSCGLALTTADWSLGKKAARNVVFSIIEVVAIAAVATKLSPLRDVTPEILARTNPNLMDLLVAFFSGLAGTLALSSRKGALTILPGVAIATAVMPPLATIGFGISTGQWGIARGSFMLFFTNFMAIVISAELVFLLVGFRPKQQEIPKGGGVLVRYRTLIAFAVLLALSIPLFETLLHAAQQVRLRRTLSTMLQAEVQKSGHKLDSVNLQVERTGVLVEAAVQTTQFIDSPEIKKWEDVLSARAGQPVRVDLQQLQLARKDTETQKHPENRDFLGGGSIRPKSAEPPLSKAIEVEKLQKNVQNSLRSLLNPAGIDPLWLRTMGTQPDGTLFLELTGSETAPTDDGVWRIAAAVIAKEVHSPVRMTGSLVVVDAIDVINYRPTAIRPGQKELRAADRFLAAWKTRPAFRYQFVSGPPHDDTSTKRAKFLHKRFPDSISELVSNAVPGEASPNTIRIQIVQVVDAVSVVSAPSSSLATPEKSTAAK